ncbi:MAG: GNAT family N-acetyltransferase [Pseudomonadales bacterium]
MKTAISVHPVSIDSDLVTLVQQINGASWTVENDIGEGEYTAEGLHRYLLQSGHIFLSASVNGEFAGMAAAAILEKAYANNRWLYVDELDVAANFRRLGVGAAIMRFLLRLAKEHECMELWLGTETDNVAAKALYKSLAPSETEPFVGFTYSLL